MPEIRIAVADKIAQVQGAPQIVCGNSDYTAAFEFDSEWNAYDEKTVRVVWRDITTGAFRRENILLTGSSCALPAIYNTNAALIGVYAGDIHTTTPARIPCARCITDDAPVHDPPPPDIYEQLLAYLETLEPHDSAGLSSGAASLKTTGTTVMIAAGIATTREIES